MLKMYYNVVLSFFSFSTESLEQLSPAITPLRLYAILSPLPTLCQIEIMNNMINNRIKAMIILIILHVYI